MVPILLMKASFGIRYPASKTIGGNIKTKNIRGVNTFSSSICVEEAIDPIIRPRMISIQHSGILFRLIKIILCASDTEF